MKNSLAVSLLILAAGISVSDAAPPRDLRADTSGDSQRRGRRPPSIPNMPEAAQSPSNQDVGDGDSFGRSVNFLGFAQVEGVAISSDCTGSPPERCVVATDPDATTSIAYIGDEAVVKLPGRSARSLLCFTLTPLGDINFYNPSSSRQQANAVIGASWRIESDVLADPTLVSSVTGLPFGGFISSGTQLATEFRTLDPGENQIVLPLYSRSCISGHLSRRSLVEMGLTEAQARDVFRKPMTIRFGARASARYATAYSGVGVRIYGD
jgi:hypothetical protein